MAIMVIYDALGFRPQDYEQIRAAIGWESNPAEGCSMHLLGHDAAGLTDVQIWESEDVFDAYVAARFHPAFERLGLPYPPAPRIMHLYNAVQDQSAEAHVPRLERAFA